MPTVGVKRDELFARLGRSYTEDEFQQLCFDFGLELDEVTSEKQMKSKELGVEKAAADLNDEVIYKIDVPANRYDLLCVEGIARALLIFLGKQAMPQFKTVPPEGGVAPLVLTIDASVLAIRPHAVAAVLRGVTFTPQNYKSFIDLQEKLHQNLCRRRSLVAIGTHDLDTIQSPFSYTAVAPADIKFKPLRAVHDKEYTAAELMVEYAGDMQLKAYLPLIRDSPVYPVIRDAHGVVLSLPPIINSHHSRITLGTRNVFIECTATDHTKAKITLNILVTMFSEYCAQPFEVEHVSVVAPSGVAEHFPQLASRTEFVSAAMINKRIGIARTAADFAGLLTKMQLPSIVSAADPDQLAVIVPPVRPDVLHECDIWEDAAIAHGYNNIERARPKVVTTAKQQPINKLTDQLREVIAQASFCEALTFALADAFDFLRRSDDGSTAAVISNPRTKEFQIARPNLLSGLLKTIVSNSRSPLPIKVFEVSDVVLRDAAAEVGARNERRLGAAICNKSPGFEVVQGLLDVVMRNLGVPFVGDLAVKPAHGYYLIPSQDPAFFGELGAADIIFKGCRVGVIGVVHPEVLKNYGIALPVGALELNIEPFL